MKAPYTRNGPVSAPAAGKPSTAPVTPDTAPAPASLTRPGHHFGRVAVAPAVDEGITANQTAPIPTIQRRGTVGGLRTIGPAMLPMPQASTAQTADAAWVQRYTDVKAAYGYPNRPQDEQLWLDDYAEIQAFLADRPRIKPHLQALANRMVERDIDLSAALATFEAGTWAAARPTMIGFVSAAQFEDVVAKGQIFEDLVASAHGVQTHRIQWFCIKREDSLNQGWLNHTVINLFKDAVAPRWRQAGLIAHKNMWDFIVDNTGDTDAFDFTKPENLEAYLSEEWLPFWYFRRWNAGELTADVRAGHAARPITKQQYKDAWNNQASAAQKAQAIANNNARITVGGTIFTGFTAIGEPTIAYPAGANPEASV